MSISGVISTSQSALVAQASRIGAVAGNLANVSTPGFKATDINFSSIGPDVGGGVDAHARQTVSVSGPLIASASHNDLAVAGRGFLPVQPVGGGEALYTRTGSFSVDASGYLSNADGLRLLGLPLDAGGHQTSSTLEPVQIGRAGTDTKAADALGSGSDLSQTHASDSSSAADSPDGPVIPNAANVSIKEDGTVVVTADNGLQFPLYRIPVMAFPNPDGLQAQQGQTFRSTAESGDPVQMQAGSGSTGSIQSSATEQSNVDVASESIRMILAKAAYTVALQTMAVGETMVRQTLDLKS